MAGHRTIARDRLALVVVVVVALAFPPLLINNQRESTTKSEYEHKTDDKQSGY